MQDFGKAYGDLRRELKEAQAKVAQLEAALAARQRTKEQFLHVLNMAPVLICTAGLDGYYKQVNPAFERILGCTQEELLALRVDDIHPAEALPARRGWFAAVDAGIRLR